MASREMTTLEGLVMPKVGGRLFADEVVLATTLYRQGKAVLDMARERPVTITRNDQHFALMRREVARQYSAIAEQVTMFSEAMSAASTRRQGDMLRSDHPFRWLNAFDTDELADFVEELIWALAQVVQAEDLEAVETGIYEWQQSSIAVESEALAEAFDSEADPVPLTAPMKYQETEQKA